ncbi:hypothetical protein E2320_010313 [Naja naja]|nr:hypothetical protein E2320_010313 [Naja naja]
MSIISVMFLCPARIFLICAIVSFLNFHCSSGKQDDSLQLNRADVNVTKGRWRRSSSQVVQPIDCLLSSWSSWTACDACQKKRVSLLWSLKLTKGKYEFSMTAHESYSSFEHSVSREKSKEESFGVGLIIPKLFTFSYSKADKRYQKFASRTKRFSSTLEVAQYKLKRQDLMLHPDFFQKILRLPLVYSYGEYRDLFRDYGTHYITEATLGGTYEYTLVMNRNALEKEGYNFRDVQACTQHGVKIGVTVKVVSVTAGITVGGCNAILEEIGDTTSEKKFVEDFIALVRGGASEHITTLANKDLPNAELMQEWGDAVQYNPEIIRMKVEPLYNLITANTFANAATLKQNMKLALEEFHQETSNCQCAQCQGNGTPFLKGTRCECICPLGHEGTACERTQRTNVPIDGNWSCWSSWTTTGGRQKSRSRECNNPPPRNGGSSCPGPSQETI